MDESTERSQDEWENGCMDELMDVLIDLQEDGL